MRLPAFTRHRLSVTFYFIIAFPVFLVGRSVAMDVIVVHEYPVGRSFQVVELAGTHRPEKRPNDSTDQDQ
jgi:hypothetical protein